MKYLFRLPSAAACGFVLALCFPALAQAATLNVPAQYPTIQAAVNAASNGDTVLIADGTYTGPGNRDINFGGKNITVTSQHGAASTIINCQGSSSANHRGFYLHSGETGAVISGLTVENGYTVPGGSDQNNGYGGGICLVSVGCLVQNCTVASNTAQYGGGIYDFTNTLSRTQVTGCTATGNAVTEDGGGILIGNENGGTINVSGCMISGNTAMVKGGGIDNLNTSALATNGGGAIILTGCTISGNTGQYSGGVDNLNEAGVIEMLNCTVSANQGSGGVSNENINSGSIITITKMINCVLTGNTAQVDGVNNGSIISNNNELESGGAGSSIEMTNCTLAGNMAPQGSVIYTDNSNDSSTSNPFNNTLTNVILYGNTGTAISNQASPYTTGSTANYCDIQGGYPGTNNIDADPKFVSATDFHLQPGSPCLGAGTPTGAPATTIDGQTRPNPPSIGAYEAAPAAASQPVTAHVLWNNADGRAAVWNLSDANPAATARLFGPYAGWTAVAVAEGPNGGVRLLWDNTSGQISVWNLSDANPPATCQLYGPYSGWTAKSITVGPDNAAHLLWDNTDGHVSLWNLADPNPTATCLIAGPYAGWSGTQIAIGPDNHERLLWDNTNGQAAIWNLADANPSATCLVYGPYSGWAAKSITVGPDNAAHLLWDNTDGHVSLWNLSDSNPAATCLIEGPYDGWSGTAIALGADNQERLLWDNTGGPISVWNLSDPNPVATCLVYGPYSGWTAVGISAH